MKECKRGETLQVTIETATADGTGIARVDGQVVFVPGALPGEVCKIRIAHIGRSAVFAELLRVEQLSAHRVEPDCPYFPRCGGCALRHMDYAQELKLKRAHVYNCLTRIGGQTLSSLPRAGAERKARRGLLRRKNAHGHSGRTLPHPAGLRRPYPRSRSGLDAQIQHPRL